MSNSSLCHERMLAISAAVQRREPSACSVFRAARAARNRDDRLGANAVVGCHTDRRPMAARSRRWLATYGWPCRGLSELSLRLREWQLWSIPTGQKRSIPPVTETVEFWNILRCAKGRIRAKDDCCCASHEYPLSWSGQEKRAGIKLVVSKGLWHTVWQALVGGEPCYQEAEITTII